ncbi:signal recognition particle receptor subunit alpha homolog isoform X3 [Carya illinoinensis]|uniref:signal recognition particle receptor subunit alpha homolog isoform X3 n=1 Tax=Carya illinoinensis TaxID=32201 RepID=UPI001C719D13|nr:signal recognition particle receptor subunit alpha homolog isoform X3 [Carya illinoinensis]XP_042966103.1 signal recognition particle receptor subunit alpha homolog isoform X3 [Carya illinoinensis]XP_042966104.1 signal recognition particle receptor subunit alpha homolog isoform X3 [Carya illinoinensis]XP_042966105.1 signal recognition particle receptor subunit alpha homolog isoform X3 [Carya illinoinensis]XP_042966106.1 signal recognition particle receptor subunit alpha homolog isoform X3 [C
MATRIKIYTIKSIAGKANLEKSYLEPALKAFEDGLMMKNVVCFSDILCFHICFICTSQINSACYVELLVITSQAEEIAEKLCESVAASLEGKKLASFTRISSIVQAAMEEALVRILTPRCSVDILRDMHAAREQTKPYVVVFVSVNGVGKSTNLAKVAYWLLQHEMNVMMAACDTF